MKSYSDLSSAINGALLAASAISTIALINACKSPSSPESIDVTSGNESCLRWGSLCYENLIDTIKLVDDGGFRSDYRGQTWGIAWGNANGNQWPDLYLNHHRETNTKGRFPTSHLILDLGKSKASNNFLTLGSGDQHSAIFHDFDGDGTDEILETIGGLSGQALESNTDTHNQVHKIKGNQSHANIAPILGVEQAGARGRQAVPFVIQQNLYIAFMNQKRKDGKYGPNIMKRNTEGGFETPKIHYKECFSEKCKAHRLSLSAYKILNYGYVNDDQKPDLILCQNSSSSDIKLLLQENNPEVFRQITGGGGKRAKFCLPAFFPAANKNLIATETRKGISLLAYEPKTNNIRTIKTFPLIRGIKSQDLSITDLNNDGLPDIVSLQHIKSDQGGSTSIAAYLSHNRGCTKAKPFNCYSPISVDISSAHSPRNFAISDFNNDGTLDILIGAGKTSPGPYKGGRYILIGGRSTGKWLSVDLRCRNGTNGIGANVSITTDTLRITKLKTSGTRQETQDDARLHFGLGNTQANKVRLEVNWPNGKKTTVNNQPINTNIIIDGKDSCT